MTPQATRPSHSRRTPKMSGDDRERTILEAFEGLLETKALHEISIDEIARGAGISRPTFYFYFASKEAVLLSLFERMIDEAQAARGDALEQVATDPEQGIRQSLTAFYDVFRAHRAVTLAGADARATSADVRDLWANVMEGWVTETADAIAAGREAGLAPDNGIAPRDLAIALLLMNEQAFHTALSHQSPAIAEDGVVDVLTGVWLGAIYGGRSRTS